MSSTVFPRKDAAATIYFQLYRNAATIRRQLLFEVQTSQLLFISAIPQCGDYSRAATIRGAAFIRGNMVIVILIIVPMILLLLYYALTCS